MESETRRLPLDLSLDQVSVSLILSGRTVKGRVGWVSLGMKGNSRIAINGVLILGQRTSPAAENNCMSGGHTELAF